MDTTIEPGLQVSGPPLEDRNVRYAPHLRQPPAGLVAASGQSEADDPDPVVGTGVDEGPLEGHQALDIAGVQQRLFVARGDVRVEPACLEVRGDGFLVQSAIATGVDEPGEELRIIAMTIGLAHEAHERSMGLTDVRLEVCVELVRDRQTRGELQGAAEGPPG